MPGEQFLMCAFHSAISQVHDCTGRGKVYCLCIVKCLLNVHMGAGAAEGSMDARWVHNMC